MKRDHCVCCFQQTEGDICPHCHYPELRPENGPHMPVGRILQGRYRVGRVTVRADADVSYLALDAGTGERVLLREYHPGFISTYEMTGPKMVAGQALCAVRGHEEEFRLGKNEYIRNAVYRSGLRDEPAVADVLDIFQEGGTVYVVEEELRGRSLKEHIFRRGGRLTPRETVELLRPVAVLLARAAKDGIYMGCLEPDVIFLDPARGGRLQDLGADAANAMNSMLRKHSGPVTVGEQGFRSIEVQGGKTGPESDVYSFCATILYCVSGIVPTSPVLRLTDNVEPCWDALSGFSAHHRAVIRKGLEIMPGDRIRDMEQLYQGLYASEAEMFAPEKKRFRFLRRR